MTYKKASILSPLDGAMSNNAVKKQIPLVSSKGLTPVNHNSLIVTCTLQKGTTTLTFFDKMEPPRPDIDVKRDTRSHL
jgi:hypothetical protein